MDADPTDEPSTAPPGDGRNTDDHRYVWPKATLAADRFRWPRRIFFTLALVAAAAFVVYAFDRAPNNEVAQNLDPAIVREVPIDGSHVLHQAQVGVELKQGYDGRITINGVPIPEDEMDDTIPTTSPLYDPSLGPRPNTKYEVFYTPGPGKTIDSYGTGQVTISVSYWKIADGEANAKTLTWHISVN